MSYLINISWSFELNFSKWLAKKLERTYCFQKILCATSRAEIAPNSPITKRFLAGSLSDKLGLYCMAGNWVGIVRVDSWPDRVKSGTGRINPRRSSLSETDRELVGHQSSTLAKVSDWEFIPNQCDPFRNLFPNQSELFRKNPKPVLIRINQRPI